MTPLVLVGVRHEQGTTLLIMLIRPTHCPSETHPRNSGSPEPRYRAPLKPSRRPADPPLEKREVPWWRSSRSGATNPPLPRACSTTSEVCSLKLGRIVRRARSSNSLSRGTVLQHQSVVAHLCTTQDRLFRHCRVPDPRALSDPRGDAASGVVVSIHVLGHPGVQPVRKQAVSQMRQLFPRAAHLGAHRADRGVVNGQTALAREVIEVLNQAKHGVRGT